MFCRNLKSLRFDDVVRRKVLEGMGMECARVLRCLRRPSRRNQGKECEEVVGTVVVWNSGRGERKGQS